ncbi:hypothetical protein AYO20_02460 [Fonsecaea nubica]|uniref:Uncharacterized protein n=1 Tax=Fonsecaea nubica TaxID=856822 RepID=A0A178DAX2_9EURO|nr:hypothetical protein AYO20_02460 [Fonsecaea nubica]OAL38401.1 hypothetical protein AYO20_02460 [Fonsecaea nubica]
MGSNSLDRSAIEAKYAEERQKRLRDDGTSQYIDVMDSKKLNNFARDPWAWSEPLKIVHPPQNGDKFKVVILGAGFAGILYGAYLLQAGLSLDDLLLLDRASGFGGTWYWNRYPGVMCDVESYIYLPLLEATGYMPRHKYSYGNEIMEYANILASKFRLHERALFDTEVEGAAWDEYSKEWTIKATHTNQSGEPQTLDMRSNFFILAPGLLTRPKIPAILGIEEFSGHYFHTSRWDYSYTGGSPNDWSLTNLQNKKVAVIGTGATAIQVVPEVAKWARHLYVVQRTPAGVDVRGQHPTDPNVWRREIATKPGWQEERVRNFLLWMSDPYEDPETDMVNDAWSKFRSAGAQCGGPRAKALTIDTLEDFINRYKDMDLERTERIRQRVDTIIQNPDTAASLKAWYARWCKRPCFHDDYLAAFNRSNVQLVDTDGAGLTRVTKTGFSIGMEEYDADVIIFSTGFEFGVLKSPDSQAGITVTGRNGLTLSEEWERGLATLYGITTHDFPNMFFWGVSQSTASPKLMISIDTLAKHAGYMISNGLEAAKAKGSSKPVVEATAAGEEDWSNRIVRMALAGAVAAGCTPSYQSREGELERLSSSEDRAKVARAAPWLAGALDFFDIREDWKTSGDLEGLEVSAH